MKILKIDSKGNIIVGTTAILIISLILISVFAVASLNYLEKDNIKAISNDNFKYIIEDYNKNLEVIFHQSVKEASEKVVSHKNKLYDSQREIKNIFNEKLEHKNQEYMEKYGISISSNVISVENSDKPIYLLSKVNIKASKDSDSYNSILTTKTSVEGLKDPLPFAICGKYPTFSYDENRIRYNLALTTYLTLHGITEDSEAYIGASSPLIIKQCPYDPYTHHGDGFTLKDCLNKGYFHESADGSCYLCRLEGKTVCPHYGFEVFILPGFNVNEKSVSGSDHVVFHDLYPGLRYDYDLGKCLFLDSSHRLKYGLI